MKKSKTYDVNEISRLAFYKYKLSGKRAMNTFLFSSLKKYELTDSEFEKIIELTNTRIEEYDKEKEAEFEAEFFVKFPITINGKAVNE